MYPNFEYEKWALRVASKPNIDGGGQHLALAFEEIIKRSSPNPQYKNLLEIGCGPAWIGLWLKHRGLCDTLTLADINPQAINCVNQTIANRKLKRVEVFHSNLFNDMPEDLKFDCMVLNTHNYLNIQQDHVLGYLGNDLRASDPQWRFHRNFYNSAAKHLQPDGVIFITEIAQYDKEVILEGEVYDRREVEPIVDFTSMANDSGLRIKSVVPVATHTYFDEIGVGIHMLQVVHKKPEPLVND